MKRSFVVLLAVLTVLSLCPVSALAEAAENGVVFSANVEAPVEAVEASALPDGLSFIPVYQSQSLTYDLTEAKSVKGYVSDYVNLYPGESRIQSFTVSDPQVVQVVRDYVSVLTLYMNVPGKAEVAFVLEDGREFTVKLKVKDPWKPTAIAMDADSFTLRVGQDMNVLEHVRITPEWADAMYQFKSSSGKVTVDENGLMTGRKPGKAVVTVTTDNRLKARFTVTVTANRAEELAPAPTEADVKALTSGWTLWPQALEMTADGGAVLEACVLNGTGAKLKAIEDLDLALVLKSKSGKTTIARHYFDKIGVRCGAGASKRVKLTFPPESVQQPYADLSACAVRVKLYSNPKARAAGAAFDFVPSAYLASEADPEADNPTVYRALLVSEDDFYWGTEPGDESKWEHDGRNRGDVRVLADVLGSVKTPNGSQYSVTIQNNTGLQQLLDLIADTFADADENDVSLFFIATHGVDEAGTPPEIAGALGMASLTDAYPELLYIGTLRDSLMKVPGKVIVLIQSCGGGAAIYRKNGETDKDAAKRACAAFDAAVVDAFRGATISETDANTGELRKLNKFYVLTAAAFEESSFGIEYRDIDGINNFTSWLAQGVGHSGSMPADQLYAGNSDGGVDLHELYRYISAVGDNYVIRMSEGYCCQHVQVYPVDTRYPLFR